MFATHYHELTQLADELVAVRNYNVAVREVGEEVLFLHRLQPGGADRSYGIEVGRLAGLPVPVLARARQVLALLEGEHLAAGLAPAGGGHNGRTGGAGGAPPTEQLALFAPTHAAVERLRALDPNAMTPLEALMELAELVKSARGEGPFPVS